MDALEDVFLKVGIANRVEPVCFQSVLGNSVSRDGSVDVRSCQGRIGNDTTIQAAGLNLTSLNLQASQSESTTGRSYNRAVIKLGLADIASSNHTS